MPVFDPISLQGHLDWLILSDSEDRMLHLYLDTPILQAHRGSFSIEPADPARIGSAAWQAAQVAENRVDPTLEWAEILRAYDRAAQVYASEPPFLVQLRRFQMRLATLFNEHHWLEQLAAPPTPGTGTEAYALMVSNGSRGSKELLAPILQISAVLFGEIASALHDDDLPSALERGELFTEFSSEGVASGHALLTLKGACERSAGVCGDPLVEATLRAIALVAASAREFEWLLVGEGVEEDEGSMWDLGT